MYIVIDVVVIVPVMINVIVIVVVAVDVAIIDDNNVVVVDIPDVIVNMRDVCCYDCCCVCVRGWLI